MGFRGPAKKRTAIQAEKGVHYSKLPKDELTLIDRGREGSGAIKAGWPEMPKTISKRAAKYWEHFCQQVDQHGQVLVPSYANLVEQLCEVYASIQYLKKKRVNGDVGIITPREEQLIKTFIRLNQEFGNTPLTLTRVAAIAPPKVGKGNGKGNPKARSGTAEAQASATGRTGFAGE